MQYANICPAVFLERPNRFTAIAGLCEPKKAGEVPGISQNISQKVVCHVKNTGRCRELLIPGTSVFLEHHPDAAQRGRKTEYSLISVYKERAGGLGGRLLINMDSQAPNQAACEWLKKGGLGKISALKQEIRFGNSRFDLAFRQGERDCFMEVKGVTLENNGVASFPDAPTERGLKHLLELREAARAGYGAYVLFVIQMKGVHAFTPNKSTHPAFAEALREISQDGVRILARDCIVTRNSMDIDESVKVLLSQTCASP